MFDMVMVARPYTVVADAGDVLAAQLVVGTRTFAPRFDDREARARGPADR